MDDLKIQALEDDCPIARRVRPHAARRTVLLDAEGWNQLATPTPVRREVVPWAPPGSITARGLDRAK
jgi:hypothetical protein